MKYNVFTYGTDRAPYKEFWVTSKSAEFLGGLTDSQRLQYVVCRVMYTPANQQEMLQHAQKLASYFEEVDTAKEAVIRCTKL